MILFLKSMFRRKVTKIYISLYAAIIFIFLAVLSVTLYYFNIENNNYKNKAYIEIISKYDLSDEIKKENDKLKIKDGVVFNLDLENNECKDITNCTKYMLEDNSMIFIFEDENLLSNNIVIPNDDGYPKKIVDYYDNLNTTIYTINPLTTESYQFNIQEYKKSEFYFYYVSSEFFHKITKGEYLHYYFINNMTEKQSNEYYKKFKDTFKEKSNYVDLKFSYISPMPILGRLALILAVLAIFYIIISVIINANMLTDIKSITKIYQILGFSNLKLFCYSFLGGLLVISISYILSLIVLILILIFMNIFFSMDITMPLFIYHFIVFLYFSLILFIYLIINQIKRKK